MGSSKKPVSATPHADRGGGGKESVESVLTMPAGIDPDWRERIELAKRAYRDGRKLREGKPILFPTSRPLRLDYGRYAWCRTAWCETRRTMHATYHAALTTNMGTGAVEESRA